MKFLVLVVLVLLCGCSTASTTSEKDTEVTTETTQVTEALTTEAKTEEPIRFTSASTEALTTEVTTEKATEKKTEKRTNAPTTSLETKTEETEAATEDTTEKTSNTVYIDGYGEIELQYSAAYNIMDGHLTRSNGSIRVFGHRETWYSTNEGCGKNTAWPIPGKHVADDGTIRDEDGYVCVASSDHRKHAVVMTSVGPGKVYDTGCSHGTIDVYTNW